MVDKVEEEGSHERAADRGRADDPGFPVGDKPSLGDAAVVMSLVTEFASRVVDVRKRYNQDEITGDEAQDEVRALARDYGSIVMGGSADYTALPWNDPLRLGRRIKLVVPSIDGVSDPGELLFLTIGTSLSSLASALEAGRVSDTDGKAHTKLMLEDTASLILGLR